VEELERWRSAAKAGLHVRDPRQVQAGAAVMESSTAVPR
jgi:hypothetical protein